MFPSKRRKTYRQYLTPGANYVVPRTTESSRRSENAPAQRGESDAGNVESEHRPAASTGGSSRNDNADELSEEGLHASGNRGLGHRPAVTVGGDKNHGTDDSSSSEEESAAAGNAGLRRKSAGTRGAGGDGINNDLENSSEEESLLSDESCGSSESNETSQETVQRNPISHLEENEETENEESENEDDRCDFLFDDATGDGGDIVTR